MAASYVPATEQLVVEVDVRNLARAVDLYRSVRFEILAPPSPQANVRVMVPDVDTWWCRATAMGARVLSSIADRDYGLRDFTIADPDGFGIRFATRIENP